MAEIKIIWLLAIGLGLASIFGYIAQKAKQSPIIGYLLAGYLIGPHSPGFVADAYIAEQLANIGVTLLMFAVGLNFNWKDLIAVKKIAVPGAITLSILSIVAGTTYSIYLGESFISGFVIGLAICVSSTVVIVRVLSDKGILHTPQGHIVIGWTIVEDLISVFGLLILPAFASKGMPADNSTLNVVYSMLFVLAKIAILGVIVYLFGEKIIDKILKAIARTRSHELFTLVILAIAFLIAISSAYVFGVSLALGAFIAGTIVGKTEVSHQAAANALPMRDAFAVIFFVSVGMLFSPLAVTKNLSLFLGVLAILLLLRPIMAFIIVKIAKYPAAIAFTIALAIAQIGEYSFILAEEGNNLGILPDNAYDILVASSFITIGLNPILFQIFRKFFTKVENQKTSFLNENLFIEELSESEQTSFFSRAVVIGYGHIGQESANYLAKNGYDVVIIDQNIDTISSLQKRNTIFGDATQFYILEKAKIENASLLVITVPDFSITKLIIQTARNINPYIKIIARIRFKPDLKDTTIGDVLVICDEEASSKTFISAIHSLRMNTT